VGDPGTDRLPAQARATADGLRTYFADHVERRRRAGRDDLLADVVAAERSGALSAEEIPGLCLLLYIAGTETVADFIGNALVALAEHPEQRALLAAQIELHGVAVPAGGAVALLWGAANRDERRWECPDELDLGREPRRHLAFGEGIHHCLGAPLARLQGRVVLEETLRAMPGYRLAGEPVRMATHNTRGVAQLAILPA
jgi:cytochrome P450